MRNKQQKHLEKIFSHFSYIAKSVDDEFDLELLWSLLRYFLAVFCKTNVHIGLALSLIWKNDFLSVFEFSLLILSYILARKK